MGPWCAHKSRRASCATGQVFDTGCRERDLPACAPPTIRTPTACVEDIHEAPLRRSAPPRIAHWRVGILIATHPAVGAGIFALLLAMLLLANGLARISYSIVERFPSWSLVSGISSVLLGVLVLVELPTSAFWFLGLVVAIELLFRGTTWIVLGFALHRSASRDERSAAGHARPAMA